jgi:hypothetical protein
MWKTVYESLKIRVCNGCGGEKDLPEIPVIFGRQLSATELRFGNYKF